MTDTKTEAGATAPTRRPTGPRDLLRITEIDARMLGMLVALAVIWGGFHWRSGGRFLTSGNLWNLSVQTASVAIMATGMVLVIVSRNIDLSVGSMLAVVGMVMGLMQAEWIPQWLGFDHPATWAIALAAGIVVGAAIGGLQGVIIAYVGVPSFIVTLGGLLVWRGVALWMSDGQTIAPMDSTFRKIGGGPQGAIGGTWSWVVGIVLCAGIVALLVTRRRSRAKYEFHLRPMWAEVAIGVIGCGAVLAGIYILNRNYLPERLAQQWAADRGIEYPAGGLQIALGLAIPVLIMAVVALAVTWLATKRRFGRYVYAIGGNPEASELAGIRTKWTIVKTFMLMGVLVAIAAAVQVGRLNAAVSSLGQLNELYVIAAAVIGGTSFAGGIGTVSGAVLGALVMQSLQSGMVQVGVDAPVQDIVTGIVLVIAVTVDSFYRRGAER